MITCNCPHCGELFEYENIFQLSYREVHKVLCISCVIKDINVRIKRKRFNL